MLKKLKAVDPEILTMRSGDGNILVSNKLQGRIFAEIDDVLMHQFLADLAADPDPEAFNNLGGNSLWPGPEGGDFAFNYPPNGSWYVQKGINQVPTATEVFDLRQITVVKDIELLNRRGNTVKLRFRRSVTPLAAEDFPAGKALGLKYTGYHSVDELIPLEKYHSSEAIWCAWSLEQFPGAEGISGFGRCRNGAQNCANSDFYGDPGSRLQYDGDIFKFELGGPKRLQIGIKASARPDMIGALDRGRKMLALRFTPERNDGRYINIADNDQPSGPYGAEDVFSIFNGSQELNFFELETIAPMNVDEDGFVLPGRLESLSIIATAELPALTACMEAYGVKNITC